MVSRLGPRFEGLAPLILPVGVVVVVLAIIAPTVMPGLGLWDTGEFQTVPPILGTMHPTGYPTYVLLGFVVNLLLAPIGEPAYRMNVMSLLAVAAAAALAASTVRALTGRAVVAAAVGIGLALTPVVWGIATRADAHALHLAFVALLITCLVRWERGETPAADRWLIGAAVVFGLAAGNHSLTLLLALPIALFVLAVEPAIIRRPRLIAGCLLAAFGSLALVYLELPLRAGPFRASLVYADPETWSGFWYIALAEQFRGVLGNPFADLLPKLGQLADLGLRQLGLLAFAVPLAFVVTAARMPRFALLTGAAFLITVLFNAAYSNADLGRYYLGPVLLAWLWLGVLAATIVDRAMALADRPVELGGAAEAAESAESAESAEPELDPGRRRRGELGLAATLAAVLLLPTITGFSLRAEQLDRSSDTSARRWLDAMFETLPENSVVVSWWSYSTPLWYGQHVEGRRPDIMIIDDRTLLDLHLGEAADAVAVYLDQRPVYVIRANGDDLGKILRRFDLEPLANQTLYNVWHVTGRRASA